MEPHLNAISLHALLYRYAMRFIRDGGGEQPDDSFCASVEEAERDAAPPGALRVYDPETLPLRREHGILISDAPPAPRIVTIRGVSMDSSLSLHCVAATAAGEGTASGGGGLVSSAASDASAYSPLVSITLVAPNDSFPSAAAALASARASGLLERFELRLLLKLCRESSEAPILALPDALGEIVASFVGGRNLAALMATSRRCRLWGASEFAWRAAVAAREQRDGDFATCAAVARRRFEESLSGGAALPALSAREPCRSWRVARQAVRWIAERNEERAASLAAVRRAEQSAEAEWAPIRGGPSPFAPLWLPPPFSDGRGGGLALPLPFEGGAWTRGGRHEP